MLQQQNYLSFPSGKGLYTVKCSFLQYNLCLLFMHGRHCPFKRYLKCLCNILAALRRTKNALEFWIFKTHKKYSNMLNVI